MARRQKNEEAPKGSPEWMTTFSDLMNLLLCFFVLLFSMSTVDADKWEEVVNSMTSSFSLWKGGYTSIGEGLLISAGTSQLTELGDFYTTMGEQQEETEGEQIVEESLAEQLKEANQKETELMLDNISEKLENDELENIIDIAMDPEGKYVELLISGAFLFDSGKADLKEECIPVISKLGDILKLYDDYMTEIIGHTDNVPMVSGLYPDNDHLSSARAISAKNYLVQEKGMDVTKMKWSGKGEYEPIASNATEEGRARNRRVEIRIYNSLNSDN